MFRDRICHPLLQWRCLTRNPKGTIPHTAPFTPCNLGQFIGRKRAHSTAIKFAKRRKGDVVHIEVQPHTNRICCNQIINIPILIKLDLRVSRPRAQRPHNHRCTAFLTADQFGDCINAVDREPNNRAAWGHARYFFGPRIGQLAHPFAAHDLNVWHQFGNRPTHGISPQEQCFLGTPCAQKAICEHMTALRIGAELDFIHHRAFDAHVIWHRLDRTNPICSTWRNNAFFACHQGHNRGPADRNKFVVNFTRQ